jgi:hypothetical protein
MSKEALAKVVQRAISDGAFRRQLSNDPTGALRGFDLTPAETAAIRSGDSGRLTAFGVDLRMSKAFTLFGSDSGSQVVTSDLGAGNAGALITGDAATGSGALVTGDGAMGSGALVTGDGATGSGALVTGDGATGSGVLIGDNATLDPAMVADGTASSDPMIASGNEIGRAGAVLPGDPAHAFGAVTGTDTGSDGVIVTDDGTAASLTNVAPDGYATDEGQLTNDSPFAEAPSTDVQITTGESDLDQ